MTKEELFELVDIETGEDFTYFENFANLMEADEYLTEEDIGMLLRELDCITFSELAESSCYATDLSSGKENLISIRDAIYENKLAGITKTDWVFDFSDCDQLEISEYIINVGELS